MSWNNTPHRDSIPGGSGGSGGSGSRSGSGSGSRIGSLGDSPTGPGITTAGVSDNAIARAKAKADAEEAKRRKIQRACDVCRRKKIKCDGPMNSLSASKCAHCQEYGLECTYVEAAKRRGPPKGYVDTLEQRCGRLERLLQQLHPGVDLIEYVGPPLDREEFDQSTYSETLKHLHIPPYPQIKAITHPLSKSSSAPNTHSHASPSSGVSSPATGPPSSTSTVLGPAPWKTFERDPSRPPDVEEDGCGMDAAESAQVAEAMQRLDIHDGSWRFHGKASGAHLIRLFNTLKYKAEEGPTAFLERVAHLKRQEYWHVPEWEVVVANEGVRPVDYSIWPPSGLDTRLIEAYFDKVNCYLPLLNRIIFLRQYEAGTYKTSHEFAKVCLMVFANGARFIDDDERVFWPRDWAMSEEGKERLKADTDGTIRYSGGWIYVRALMRMGRSIAQGPNLYDFQCQVLFCTFLQGAAVPHLMWVLSGLGLRSAQEIGIHVRSTLMLANPAERALYNRAFWCLYHIDRVNCAAIGRSVALQDTDFDADYPILVDDEYWDTGNPDTDFVQPGRAGVPQVAAFVHMLKLDHVLGAALRTIYAINKLPEHHADPNSQRAVVVELDSALNAWADSVPDGLRWDPTRADQRLFEQSAMLYSQYYFCQILIHRPFIPTPAKSETIGLPSLAICSNASRSIANILDALLRRGRQYGHLPGQSINIHFMLPAWTAAVILLVSIYTGKQQPSERERAMMDVQRCIAAMKEMELTWRQAGKLTDVLMELSSDRMDGGTNPIPPVSSRQGNGGKRSASGVDVLAATTNSAPISRVTSRSDMGHNGSGTTRSQNVLRGSTSSTSLRLPQQSPPTNTQPTPLTRPNSTSPTYANFPVPPTSSTQFPPNRPTTPPNLWTTPPNQVDANLGQQPMFYATDSTRDQSRSFRRPINGFGQGQGSSSGTAPASSIAQNDVNTGTPGFNLFSQYAHTPLSSQKSGPPNPIQSRTGQPSSNDMLWDASFLEALNPELFGMGDVSSNGGIDSTGMGMGMGMGTGGSGGENVDDLWAQLFGANSQGLWTPNIGQGGPMGGSGSGFGGPGQPF